MPFPTRYGKNTKRRSSPKPADMSAIKNTAKAADKAGSRFFRWMTKDHANVSTWIMLIEKPTSGFWPWVGYFLKCIFIPLGIVLARVFAIIILYILLFAFLAFLFFGFGSK
jgi:hypothetical protein